MIICTLSETDISNAEEVAKVLKPMKDATSIMSEDSTPTLLVIAPLHAQLLQDMDASSAVSQLVWLATQKLTYLHCLTDT